MGPMETFVRGLGVLGGSVDLDLLAEAKKADGDNGMSNLQVNQTVWFWKDGEGRGRQPEPAIVTKVHDENMVDLWVFCGHGAQRSETKVAIRLDDAQRPLVRYATLKPCREEVAEAREIK
jgi:hypothetical protein